MGDLGLGFTGFQLIIKTCTIKLLFAVENETTNWIRFGIFLPGILLFDIIKSLNLILYSGFRYEIN